MASKVFSLSTIFNSFCLSWRPHSQAAVAQNGALGKNQGGTENSRKHITLSLKVLTKEKRGGLKVV
jgi:hypothetical protein